MAKWRKRETVEDRKTGPKEPRSTVLTEAEEAAFVAAHHVFRLLLLGVLMPVFLARARRR